MNTQHKNSNQEDDSLNILLYKVTHDIKGPISSIIGLTNLGLAETNDKNSKEYFLRIKKNAEKLHSFVAELLNATKISIKETDYEPINFKEIIDDILNSLQFIPNFKKIKINLNIQEGIVFHSDSMMIYSIFQNIIENSIKYSDDTKKESYLNINIYSNSTKTIITFEDNGIGIEDNLNEKVFEMFFRATDNSQGNGIGLYIVKKSIEKLNGMVTLVSKLGQGTITTISFRN
jgi:hypothetical protein